MSLIVDALEKAKREGETPPPTFSASPTSTPVPSHPARRPRRGRFWLAAGGLAMVALAGGLAIHRWQTLRHTAAVQERWLREAARLARAQAAALVRAAEPASPAARLPVILPAAPEPEDPAFVLRGILFDDRQESWADINGRLLREGEAIDGAMVESIDPDRVTLRYQQRSLTLTLR